MRLPAKDNLILMARACDEHNFYNFKPSKMIPSLILKLQGTALFLKMTQTKPYTCNLAFNSKQELTFQKSLCPILCKRNQTCYSENIWCKHLLQSTSRQKSSKKTTKKNLKSRDFTRPLRKKSTIQNQIKQ